MFETLLGWIVAFWDTAVEVITWLIDQIWALVTDVLFAIFSGFLSIIEAIFNSINLTQITVLGTFQTWSGLPTQTIWLMNYINLPVCLTAIIAAYGVRFLLNLIPSWATRV